MKNHETLPNTLTLALYAPDLAEYHGLGRNINDKTIQSIVSQFHSFDNVISIMKSTSRSGKKLYLDEYVLSNENYRKKDEDQH